MQKIVCLCLMSIIGLTASAQFLSDKKNVKKFEGFFDFYYAQDEGKIYLAVDRINKDFLYVHSLRTGLGSNDIGLDRGQLGGGRVVHFVRAGNKLLLIEPNQDYRALTENQQERRSVSEAFGRSVLFGFEIKETQNGVYLIDLTPFLMEDRHGVALKLKNGKDGTYKIDKSRSAIWMERTVNFPLNSEFEAMLTFKGEPKGRRLQSVIPDPGSISVVQHHSFLRLPSAGYQTRGFDPRCGSYPLTYMDYSTEVWKPITKRLITRHRLEKKDPSASISEAVEPIVYYLDPGTPEPVRSALLDGGRWWNEAFEAIGYKNAFQVKVLPEGADPLDARYNVIQWVHRSTRGWSYGASITDPRTGEIIKGHVSLGSLRIRQDYAIAQALMERPFANEDPQAYKPMLEMALARIRQLSAHEIGHTLGFAHNYAASTFDRSSVMDYPHPQLLFSKGQIEFKQAYDVGIGQWDKVSVAYAYGDVPAGQPEEGYLKELLDNAYRQGHRFITDSDARPKGSAHPLAHLWDNGSDPVAELDHVMAIRDKGIRDFSIDNIPEGQPLTVLEDLFVPLYFFHRYQTEAAVKLIGGMEYDYLVKGGEGKQPEFLNRDTQQSALKAVINTIKPDALTIPADLLKLFPPRAFGYSRTRESFNSQAGLVFDPLAASATAADMSLGLLLNRDRANRLVLQKAMDSENLGLTEVLENIFQVVFSNDKIDGFKQEVRHSVQYITLQHCLGLLADEKSLAQVRAIVNAKLEAVLGSLDGKDTFNRELLRTYKRFQMEPEKFKMYTPPKIPDGSPIGTSCQTYFNGQ